MQYFEQQMQRKARFSFAFRPTFRNFGFAEVTRHSEMKRKTRFLLHFSLFFVPLPPQTITYHKLLTKTTCYEENLYAIAAARAGSDGKCRRQDVGLHEMEPNDSQPGQER